MVPDLERTSLPSGGRLLTSDSFHYGGWIDSPSLESAFIHSGYGFGCSACHPSASNIISGFTECLIHNHGSPNSIASDQRPHFSAKAVKNLVGKHEIHGSCHMLLSPESFCLVGW